MDTILTIALSIIGSSALFTFVQFLITRRDTRNEKFDKIISKIDTMQLNVAIRFDGVDGRIDELRSDMNDNDDKLRDALEANKATTARVRILRASDEILHKMRHSKEWFDQLNEDITFYKKYCAEHPEFINNKAKHAIENIDAVYANALKENDFL